mgnify:CR=1 FL=1|jgi:Protein of unknown function (DUF2757).
MAVNYVCKHCKTPIGSIDRPEVTEQQLGFHFLTPEERGDIISYDSNGDVTVNIVCEYCNEALHTNPDLHMVGNPLQ